MAERLVAVGQWPRRAATALIQVYQWGMAAFPSPCRFSPSCSSYTLEAVRRYGAVRGGWLGLRRILRCHPWGGSGHDPVP
ncbi:MAG TPA: membrane protein insertion efficiency factor YidD [Gemmatimonadales bacterium]